MRIDLRIERVVLEGLDVSPRHIRALRDALHAELNRLVTAAPSATWQQSRRNRRIGAPTLRLHPSDTPAAVGDGIARSVYGGLFDRRSARRHRRGEVGHGR